MGMENTITQMVMNTKEIGQMIKKKVMAIISMLMEKSMRDNGLQVKNMVLELLLM